MKFVCVSRSLRRKRNSSLLLIVFLSPYLSSLLITHSGFGFITFKDAETVQDILDAHAENPLVIDEKFVSSYKLDCHL